LTALHEKVIRRWLAECPTAFGFPNELWTAPRLADLIREELGVRVNHRYLCAWLRGRRFSPQKPRQLARERDEPAIAAWVARDWPRLKKKRGGGERP
jgi:putative transposase